jgi:hypothetical protein
MISSTVQKTLMAAIAAAALVGFASPRELAAASPDTAVKVTFTASGTFASPPLSGADALKLAGLPFTITVVGPSSMKPVKHGRNWAIYKPLTMTGTIFSGLVPNQPIGIASNSVELQQTAGDNEDIITFTSPVTAIGISVTVTAKIYLPGGTLGKPLIRPFPSTAINTALSTVTYSNPTASTTLGIQTGTLGATAP